jgi:predicted RNase H-like HicB family nuclease/plasmid stability protein
MTVQDYLKLPYHVVITHRVDESGDYYFATVQEMDGCMSDGATPEAAAKNIREAMELWIDGKLDGGYSVPEPFKDLSYSGKFVLRLPKSLHAKLAMEAAQEGVSLNQYALYRLSVQQKEQKVPGTAAPPAPPWFKFFPASSAPLREHLKPQFEIACRHLDKVCNMQYIHIPGGESTMPLLQVRNCPQDLYDKLTLAAAKDHRSITQETLALLEHSLLHPETPKERTLRALREIDEHPHPFRGTDEEFRQIMREAKQELGDR